MEIKSIVLTGVSITAFVIGFFLQSSMGVDLQLMPPATGPVILAIITFGFGFIFFGHLPWIMTFIAGNYMGLVFKLKEQTYLNISFTSLSILLMAFASISLGTALYADMTGKGNFSEKLRKNIIIIAIALVLAVIAQFVKL